MTQLQEVPIKQIRFSTTEAQVARRKLMTKATLSDLAQSIKEQGVVQPVIVRPANVPRGTFELVAGERRVRASELAELERVPAVVRELDDKQVIEVQLIENLQREDVHPMQEAEGYQELTKNHGVEIEELYHKVGKSRTYVYGRMKLLDLCKEARKAFHENKMSASVALLIARIPHEKLQREALKELLYDDGDPPSYRYAKEEIERNFMLRLKDASFPTDDANLVPAAGACGACPKRTGNQPELFNDIKSADVCTDPACFQAKNKAHASNRIKEAKAAGKAVITGAAAKKVAPHGDHYLRGYTRLDDTEWVNGSRKRVSAIVGKDAETELLQLPESRAVVEVVKESVLKKAMNRGRKKTGGASTNSESAERKRRNLEKKFRAALYNKIRPKLKRPTTKEVALRIAKDLDIDTAKIVCQVRGLEVGNGVGSSYPPKILEKAINAAKSDAALWGIVNDLMYCRELTVSWGSTKSEKLLSAAKTHRINVAAVRKSVQPKKKTTKKKATAKKKVRKKPATKRRPRKKKKVAKRRAGR